MNLDSLVEMFLTEAKEQLSVNEIIEKAKAKQLGVKIEKNILDGLSDKIFYLTKLYNKAINEKADPVVVFKFLLSHLRNIDDLKEASLSDAPIQYALNLKKEWFRQNISNMAARSLTRGITQFDIDKWSDIEDFAFNKANWNIWSKAIKFEAKRHGKASKMHNSKTIKPIYSDGTWELYSPDSFEEEKEIAFYGENWDKPTHWCTRAQQSYFDRYATDQGEKLWVVRNKNGHTWQLAFDCESENIHFMDEDDRRPSETKKLSISFPEEIKNKIHDRNGFTLNQILNNKKEVNKDKTKYDEDNEELTNRDNFPGNNGKARGASEVRNNKIYIYTYWSSDVDTAIKYQLKANGSKLNFDNYKFTPVSKTLEMAFIDNIKVFKNKGYSSNEEELDTSYNHFLSKNRITIKDYSTDNGREVFSNTHKPTNNTTDDNDKRLIAFVAFRNKNKDKLSVACFKTKKQFIEGTPSFVVGVIGSAISSVRKYYDSNGAASNGNNIENIKAKSEQMRHKKVEDFLNNIKSKSPESVQGTIFARLRNKYSKVFRQLGFGNFEGFTNNTNSNTSEFNYDTTNLAGEFNPIRIKAKGVFNLKDIIFTNCKIKISKDNFIVNWSDRDYDRTDIIDKNSKEYNVLKSLKEDYVREVYKETKDYYEQFKKQAARKDLETDHKNWKEGKPHERSERIVREETCFNY